MIYLFDKKIAFFHNPKTAGISITQWITSNVKTPYAVIEPRHITPKHAEVFNLQIDWSFAVVRNPWDRWVSWWWYWRTVRDRIDLSFEEYTKSYWSEDHHRLVGHMSYCQPQVDFAEDVDYVIRYENFSKDFFKVKQKIGYYAPDVVTNVGKDKQDYRSYYTPELVDLIADKYKDDIEKFGYTYE